MTTSNHLTIRGICSECRVRSGSFCNLPEQALAELKSMRRCQSYARGSTIFMEGQVGGGVHLLCAGRVKLATYSEEGKAIILRIAEPGEVLGLSALISDLPYEKTAQTIEECVLSFIKKKDFLRFLETHPQAALHALRQLSSNYHKAHLQICSLGLSSSVGDKLAKLLLQWCDDCSGNGGPVYLARTHTHSDIGEMIGASRETVTRLLIDFRDRGLIKLSKAELCIPDRRRLKAAIGTKHRNGNGKCD